MSTINDKSLGELIGDLTRETSTLIRQEVQLAKTEMTEKVGAAVRGSALLIVAGVLGFVAFQVLIVTAILALAQTLSPWLAALIVGAVLLVVAGLCAFVGIGKLKKATPIPTQTIETLKDDALWAKQQVQQNG